jgi:hypothetical protein
VDKGGTPSELSGVARQRGDGGLQHDGSARVRREPKLVAMPKNCKPSSMRAMAGSSDAAPNYDDVVNCSDTSATDFPTPPGDPNGLDADGDGISCES